MVETARGPSISIIIPALNESENLGETLARASGAAEWIVVDGGSSDSTREIAKSARATVIESDRGRAAQMNAGARIASGDVLLFLHADTWLQEGCLAALAAAMEDSSVVGGAFAREFRSDSLFLKVTSYLARLRNAAIGWHLGDQAMFCRAPVFREMGGFAAMRAFEDVDFSRRLGKAGKVVTLRPAVLSSARRFEGGAAKRTLRDLGLTARYLLHPEAFRV